MKDFYIFCFQTLLATLKIFDKMYAYFYIQFAILDINLVLLLFKINKCQLWLDLAIIISVAWFNKSKFWYHVLM